MKVKSVRLPLSMHIGAPSVAVVNEGDYVKKGQMIAKANNGLSVAIHSPIDGKVKFAGKEIIIQDCDL